MIDKSIREGFLKNFDLKVVDRIPISIHMKQLENGLYVQEEFLHNGIPVSFPEFICGLNPKLSLRRDENGNAMCIETPHPILKADGMHSTITTVVPDKQGHLRGCVEQTDDYGRNLGLPTVYFGLTDNSFFYTGHNGTASYVDLTNASAGVQNFKEDSQEYENLIKPTIDQIKGAVTTYELGALPAQPATIETAQ